MLSFALESPNYPDLCRQAQLSGTVTVRVTIDENGKRAFSECVRSSFVEGRN